MAPLPPALNTIRVNLLYGIGTDSNVLNSLHWTYSGSPPVTADCVAFAGDVRASFVSHLNAHLSDNSDLEQVEVIDLGSTSGAFGINTTPSTGGRTGNSLPAGVAVLINHRIARRYRGGKPRTYLPFFSSTDIVSPSGWVSTSVSGLQTDWTAFIAAITGATSGSTTLQSFANVSYFNGHALRATPLVEPITSSAVNPIPASQRRRNRP